MSRNRLPNEDDVASAVKTALAQASAPGFSGGFKTGNGQSIAEPVTSVSAACKTDLCKAAPGRRLQTVVDRSDTFTVTVVAFAPALQPISKAVSEVSFGDEVSNELRTTGEPSTLSLPVRTTTPSPCRGTS